MFKPKSKKGFFVDISEFSIQVVRTSGGTTPMTVEVFAEFPLWDNQAASDIRAFFGTLGDFKHNDYLEARCGVCPEGRFVHLLKANSINDLKSAAYVEEKAKTDFKLDSDTSVIMMLNADDGSSFDLKNPKSDKVLFCGAPEAELQAAQDRLLEYGVLPSRMELSSVSMMGAISHYTDYKGVDSPILCVELERKLVRIAIRHKRKMELIALIAFGLDDILQLFRSETGCQEEDFGRKAFFEGDFDLETTGSKLLKRMIRPLKAFVGDYEVRRGLSIDHLFVEALPKNLKWIGQMISDSLGIETIRPDIRPWLESVRVKLADDLEVQSLENSRMALFGLMGEFRVRKEVVNESVQ